MTESAVDISIIIPFRNRELRRIEVSAESLKSAAGRLNYQVIVADCGSFNGAEVARVADSVGATLVRIERNHWSKPAVLNSAIAAARGRWVLCADVDMLWGEGSIARAVRRLDSRVLPAVLAFQTRDLPESRTAQILDNPQLAISSMKELLLDADLHSRWGNGVLLFPKSAAQFVGGYDERLTVYGVEDLDFCRRLQGAGYPFLWSDVFESPVLHVWHPPLNATVRRYDWAARALARNRAIYHDARGVVRNAVEGGFRDEPLVTVAIATRDRAGLLAEALSSVLCQTVQDFEVVVVDDGSTDDTRSVVESFSDPRLRYFYQAGRGISSARNRALDESRGFYTAVMDDDDLMPPWRLERSLEHIHAGEHGVVGSFVTFSDATGEMVSWQDPFPTLLGASIRGGFAGHPTWMIQTDVLRAFRYDETFSSAVDNNIALRMVRSGVKLRHAGEVLNLRRVHDGQVTATDVRFQGRGAKLDARWLSSGLSPEAIRANTKLGNESQMSRKLRTEELEAITPFLPDGLVNRTLVLRVDDAESVARVREAHPATVGVEAVYDGVFTAQLLVPNATWRDAVNLKSQPGVDVHRWHGSLVDEAKQQAVFDLEWDRALEAMHELFEEATGGGDGGEMRGVCFSPQGETPFEYSLESTTGHVSFLLNQRN